MKDSWYNNLTDEEIKECKGDYIGCEICRNAERCIELKFGELLSNIKKGSFFPDVEALLQESNTGIKVVSDGLSSNVDKRG